MAVKLKKMIHDAIDTLPEGIHFSFLNGRPILSNRKIDRLVFDLTGHTFVNAKTMWRELQEFEERSGYKKIESICTEQSEQLVFQFQDGKIWRFIKQMIQKGKEQYVQIEADDMTDVYALQERMHASQKRLTEQMERQKVMFGDIVKNNHEREVLHFKAQVHDQLGRCILATQQALQDGMILENIDEIENLWKGSIQNLWNIPLENKNKDSNAEDEITRVAQLIGCEVEVTGQRPTCESALRLYHMALREAITNGVRHAGADKIMVDISQKDGEYKIVISDNGHKKPDYIIEGNGLSNLRRWLEAEDAHMKIECKDGVQLILQIPNL